MLRPFFSNLHDDETSASARFVLGGLFLVVLLIGAVPQSAFAETDKGVLSRLLTELEAMDMLINEAEHAPKAAGTRLQFQYGYLRSDLEQVKDGIRQYIDSPVVPRRQPIQPIHPLNGHYAK